MATKSDHGNPRKTNIFVDRKEEIIQEISPWGRKQD